LSLHQFTKEQVQRVLTELCGLELIEISEGRNCWKALCCFHAEQTPSLKITPEGLYTCFGCGAEGGLADLVHQVVGTNHKKHAWFKILKHLGLNRESSETPVDETKPDKKKEPLPTLKQIQQWQRNLFENPEMLNYLEVQRGLNFETINRLMLGWWPKRARDGGAIVMPFFTDDHKVQTLRFRHPHRSKQEGRYTGLKGRNEIFPIRKLELGKEIIFTEGEFDAFLLEQYGYSVFTVTNGWKSIAKFAREHVQEFQGCDLVLCFDADEPGEECGRQVATHLWGVAARIRILKWPAEVMEGCDPTDFIVKESHSLVEFEALVRGAQEPASDDIEKWRKQYTEGAVKKSKSLEAIIEDLHWQEGQKGKYRVRTVEPSWVLENAVIEWISQHGGKFFRDRRKRVYLQFGKDLEEIGVGRGYRALLWKMGKINSKNPDGRIIMEALECHAESRGTRIHSFSWLYFDVEKYTLYVHLHNDAEQILRIAPGKIEVLSNGLNPYEIVLNPSPDMEPIDYQAKVNFREAFGLWKSLVYDSFATDPISKSLIAGWSWMVWLRALSQTKPLLKISGNMSTGKSIIGRLISTLIYGADRASVSTTAANFSDAAIEPLVFLDEIEAKNVGPAMIQFLKVLATGIMKRKRAAGTESAVVGEHGDALCLMTSVESITIREIQSRMYEVETKSEFKRKGFDEDAVCQEIRRHRSQILSAWFHLLAERILPAIQRGDSQRYFEAFEKEGHSKYRTNKFFSLMLLVFNEIAAQIEGFYPIQNCHSEYSLGGQWIVSQDEQDHDAGTESSVTLLFLDALLQELQHSAVLYKSPYMNVSEEDLIMGKAKGFHLDALAFHQNGTVSREVVGFRATTADLFIAFSQLGKEKGRSFEISSPRALGQRLANDRALIEKAGWKCLDGGVKRGFQRYLWVCSEHENYEIVFAKKQRDGELPF